MRVLDLEVFEVWQVSRVKMFGWVMHSVYQGFQKRRVWCPITWQASN